VADKHPLFQAAVEVGQELAKRKQAAMKKPADAFGRERIDSRTLRRRLASNPDLVMQMMSPDNPNRDKDINAILRAYTRRGKPNE